MKKLVVVLFVLFVLLAVIAPSTLLAQSGITLEDLAKQVAKLFVSQENLENRISAIETRVAPTPTTSSEQIRQPCFIFSKNGIDSASEREFFLEFSNVQEMNSHFKNAMYDSVKNELIVFWLLSIKVDKRYTSLYMKEFYRLSECLRYKSEVFRVG